MMWFVRPTLPETVSVFWGVLKEVFKSEVPDGVYGRFSNDELMEELVSNQKQMYNFIAESFLQKTSASGRWELRMLAHRDERIKNEIRRRMW